MLFPCALRTAASGATPGKDACCAAGVGGVMIGDSDLNGSQKIFTTFCAPCPQRKFAIGCGCFAGATQSLSFFLPHTQPQPTNTVCPAGLWSLFCPEVGSRFLPRTLVFFAEFSDAKGLIVTAGHVASFGRNRHQFRDACLVVFVHI